MNLAALEILRSTTILEPVGFPVEAFGCYIPNPSGIALGSPVKALVDGGFMELKQDGFYAPTEKGMEELEEHED